LHDALSSVTDQIRSAGHKIQQQNRLSVLPPDMLAV